MSQPPQHLPNIVAPSVASAPAANPHFGRLGGEVVVAQLVERFYAYMDSLPQAAAIRAMHPPDLAPVKQVLRRYLTEWLGGPALYSVERGHPRLRRKHLPFAIGNAERDAWMECMTRALADVCSDTELRQQLTQAFFKTADFLRNDSGAAAHAEHHGNRLRPAGSGTSPD